MVTTTRNGFEIQQLAPHLFRVRSENSNSYDVFASPHKLRCTCPDYRYNHKRESGQTCKHLDAVLALIHDVDPEDTYPDLPDPRPHQPHPQPTPSRLPTLPEAPASVTVRGLLNGVDCMFTLRDTDEARLLQRLEALLQNLQKQGFVAREGRA